MTVSLFREDCDYETKIAESNALKWMVNQWDYIEDMFKDIVDRGISKIIITTRSTHKTHEQQLKKVFDNVALVTDRRNSYTHHSGDYYPQDAAYPFLVQPDPIIDDVFYQEESHLAALTEETKDDIFYIIFSTTKGEGRFEKYENVYWITLPRILMDNGVQFEANRIGEIGAITLFGEARSRGFLSMMWMNFRYEDVSNISNVHFANILRESIVNPFYLSRDICPQAVFMGYHYTVERIPVIEKPAEKELVLKEKPTIFRSFSRESSSAEEAVTQTFPPEVEEQSEGSEEGEKRSEENEEGEKRSEENEEGEKRSEENEEGEKRSEENEEILILPDPNKNERYISPPSPRRAKIISIDSPKRVSAPSKAQLQKSQKKTSNSKPKKSKASKPKKSKKHDYSKKKPKPGMVINPETGRNVRIGSKRYEELIEAGILQLS